MMSEQVAEQVLEPWITTVYFCPMDESRGPLLASQRAGARGPTNQQQWWPQVVGGSGQEVENLGSVLIIDRLPATVHLGIYVVAYGADSGLLQVVIVPDKNESIHLLERQNRIHFVPAPHGVAPGVAAIQFALRDFQVQDAGLYWLAASIGRGDPTRLPLYMQERSNWP